MTDYDPTELAAAIKSRRQTKFGTKKAAYNAAKVNAATWDKAEAGDPTIRPDLLWNVVRALWPETDGDPRLVPTVGGDTQDEPGYVESPGDRASGGLAEDAVLRKFDEMSEAIREMSERLARLEKDGRS